MRVKFNRSKRSFNFSMAPRTSPISSLSSRRVSAISSFNSVRVDLSSTLTSRISPFTSRKPSSMCPLRSSRRSSVHDSLAMTAMVATVDRKPHTDCVQNVNFLCLAWDQTVNRTFDGGEIEAVVVVFAAGRGGFDGGGGGAGSPRPPPGGGGGGQRSPPQGGGEGAAPPGPLEGGEEAAQLPREEVGVDVAAAKSRGAGTGDDVPADDRAAVVAAVAVGEDRLDGAARIRGAAVFVAVLGEALEGVPAEVRAAGRGDRRVVELLELVLADVADRDPRLLRRGGVEGEAEGVAQPVAVDLIAAGLADERVVGRRRVGLAAGGARVDPQQLPQQHVLALGVVGRVAARAAVSRPEVEEVAEELQLAAVVVGVDRVGDDDHLPLRARSRPRRAPPLEPVDADVPVVVRVVDVEALAARVIRREGDREQAALTAVGDIAANVEKRLADPVTVAGDGDPPRLLDDEEEPGEARCRGDVDRCVEGADLLQGDPGLRTGRLLASTAVVAGRVAGRTAGGQHQDEQQQKRRGGFGSPTCPS